MSQSIPEEVKQRIKDDATAHCEGKMGYLWRDLDISRPTYEVAAEAEYLRAQEEIAELKKELRTISKAWKQQHFSVVDEIAAKWFEEAPLQQTEQR